MIQLHVLLFKTYIRKVEFKESVKIVDNSPVEYLYNTMYAEHDIP